MAIWQFAIWGLLLLVGGIIARRDFVYGLATAFAAIPCFIAGIPVMILAVGIVFALPLSILGFDVASSDGMASFIFLGGHTLSLVFWILWIRSTRESSGNKFGPKQALSGSSTPSHTSYVVRRKFFR